MPPAGGMVVFPETTTAVAEEDDDNVWAVASNYQQVGENRISVGSVEYAFNPTNSIQFEITHHRDREADTAEQEVEIEFKHLFNHIARDGWGLACPRPSFLPSRKTRSGAMVGWR